MFLLIIIIITQIGCFQLVLSSTTTTEYSIKSLTNSSEESLLTPSQSAINKERCQGYCSQTVCTESNITFIKYSAQHNWKIHGLRQYRNYLRNVNSKLHLISKAKFDFFPPEDREWMFHLVETAEDIRLSITTRTNSIANQTFDISVLGNSVLGNISLRLSAKTTSEDTGGIHLEWKYFDVYFLNQLVDEPGDVELQFIISFSSSAAIVSSEIDCNFSGLNFPQDMIIDSSGPPFLVNLENMMKDDKYTDLVIKTGDEEFKVHRVILANSSPVFANLIFNKTFDKTDENLLDLGTEIGSDIVEEIIHYIYTGKIEDVEEFADRVIIAAHKYGFPELKRICEEALIQQIRMGNAFSMYLLATEVEAYKLQLYTFNLMKQNKSKLVNHTEDFRKLSVHHPKIMFELFLS